MKAPTAAPRSSLIAAYAWNSTAQPSLLTLDSWHAVTELVQALESLVTLQRDSETLREHPCDLAAVKAELRKEHNDPSL